MTWQEVIAEDNAATVRNDRDRGMVYHPDPDATTLFAVTEYATGFGWRGITVPELVRVLQRDRMGIKRALRQLVEAGRLQIVETDTRGPRASRRKSYFTDLPATTVVLHPSALEAAHHYDAAASRRAQRATPAP
jgi:hypothetical protein